MRGSAREPPEHGSRAERAAARCGGRATKAAGAAAGERVRARAAGRQLPVMSRRRVRRDCGVATDADLRHLRRGAREMVAGWLTGVGWGGVGCGSMVAAWLSYVVLVGSCKHCSALEVRS